MKLNPFRKESLKRYLGTDKHFVKTLGAFDLLTIGIGAVIGLFLAWWGARKLVRMLMGAFKKGKVSL